MTHRTIDRPVRTAGLLHAVALVGPLFAAACSTDTVLEVETPDVVTPSDVASASGAEALRAGAIGRLRQAMAGSSGGGIIPISGLMADEFVIVSPRPGLEAVDGRRVDATNDESYTWGSFRSLSQVRLMGKQAIDALRAYASDRRVSIGQMFTTQAIAEVLLAEHFCSGIPLSGVEDGQPVYGEPFTTTQVLEHALAQLDSALALATDDDIALNLTRVMTGRALLNLGRFEDAAAAVTNVPTDFVYHLEYSSSSSSLNNATWVWVNSARIYSIPDQEGNNGLDFRTANDPRLVVYDAGLAQDGQNNAWVPRKYESSESPVVLADGIEARLIEAEAKLREGDAVGALADLNALRARLDGLDPLPDAGSADARVDQLFRERAFWMFGTAHRLGDLRRLVRQYDRDQAAVAPTGPYFRGGDYGNELTMPIPLDELNNPLASECIDRNP